MGMANTERFHTNPDHVIKIRQAFKTGASRNTFVKTFVLATLIGTVLVYLVSLVTALFAGITDIVYLQGGGLWENMPLILFSLFMAISFVPVAFPLPLFAVLGAFALVPPIHWCVKRFMGYVARVLRKPRDRTGQIYRMRPTIR